MKVKMTMIQYTMRLGREIKEGQVVELTILAITESAYPVQCLDVCPPVEENLNCLEVAFLSSPIECGGSNLSDVHDQN